MYCLVCPPPSKGGQTYFWPPFVGCLGSGLLAWTLEDPPKSGFRPGKTHTHFSLFGGAGQTHTYLAQASNFLPTESPHFLRKLQDLQLHFTFTYAHHLVCKVTFLCVQGHIQIGKEGRESCANTSFTSAGLFVCICRSYALIPYIGLAGLEFRAENDIPCI